MASPFEIIGVEAVIAGVAAFRASAAAIQRDLDGMSAATSRLEKQSAVSWSNISSVSQGALGLLVVGAAAGVAAIGGLAVAAIDIGANFENSMRRIATASDATAKSIDDVRATTLKVAESTPTALNDVAKASAQLAQEGISLQTINGGLLQSVIALNTATGENGGLADATRVVALAMQAWGLSEKDAGDVTNTLAGIVNNTTVKLGGLYTTLAQIAPQAAALHIPISDLGAALGVLGAGGVTSSSAGYALNQVFARLLNPTKTNLELMKQYGVSLQDAAGHTIDLRTLIDRLNKAFSDEAIAVSGVTEAQRDQAIVALFGQRGLKDALVLVEAGVAGFDKFKAAIAGTDVNKLADQLNAGLIPQLGILRNNLEAVAVVASGPINTVLGGLVTRINDLLRAMDPNIPKAFGAALAAITTGGASAGSNVGQFISGFSKEAQNGINAVITVALALRVAVTEGIIPSFVRLFETVSGRLGSLIDFNDIIDKIVGAIIGTAAVVSDLTDRLTGLVQQIQTSEVATRLIREAFVGLLALPLIGLVTIFGGIAGAVGGILAPALLVVAAVVGIQEAIRHVDQVRQVFVNIGAAVSGVVPFVQNVGLHILALGIIASDVVRGTIVPIFEALVGALLKVDVSAGDTRNVLSDALRVITVLAGLIPAVVERFANWAAEINRTGVAVVFVNELIRSFTDSITVRFPNADLQVNTLNSSLSKVAATVGLLISPFTFFGAIMLTVSAYVRIAEQIIAAFPAILRALLIAFIPAAVTINDLSTSCANVGTAFVKLGQTIVSVNQIVGGASSGLVKIVVTALDSIVTAINTVTSAFGITLPTATQTLASVSSTLKTVEANAKAAFLGIDDDLLNFAKRSNATFSDALNDVLNWEGATSRALPAVGGRMSGLADLTQTAFAGIDNALVRASGVADTWSSDVQKSLGAVISAMAQLGLASADAATTVGRNFGLMDLSVATAADDMISRVNALMAALNSARAAALSVASAGNGPGLARPGEPGPIDTVPTAPLLPDFGGGDGGIGFPSTLGGGGGGAPKAQTLRELVNIIEQLIKDIPGAGTELAKFLAQLEQADPGRLGAMVGFLHEQKSTIEEMVVATEQLLSTENQLAAVNKTIADLTAQQEALTLQRDAAEIGLTQQLDQLNIQRLQVQQQLAPIERAIRDIDAQITALNAQNLIYVGQELRIQQQMLPIQNQIADIDQKIADAQREDFGLSLRIAQNRLDQLPIVQKIAVYEQAINDVINQRQVLLEDIASLQAGIGVRRIQGQLDAVTTQLNAAWKDLNVPAILAAEAQKRILQASLVDANAKLKLAQDAAAQTNDTNKIAQDLLKLQEQGLIDQLKPLQAQLVLLQNKQDLEAATSAVTVATLNREKAGLEDLLRPLQDQLTAIQRVGDAQKLANDIAINGLEQQKQKLLELAKPLRDMLQSIDDQRAALQLQYDLIDAHFKVAQDQIKTNLLNASLEKLAIQAIELEQNNRFKALVQGYEDAAVSSGAFTVSEAGETLKRLNFTQQQIDKWIDDQTEIDNTREAAKLLTAALAAIPTDIVVHIHTIYDTSGAPPNGVPVVGAGVGVGGPIGGGSTPPGTAPPTSSTPTSVAAAGTRAVNGGGAGGAQGSNVTYNVNATYTQPQDAGSVAMDLRALVAMTK